jgi:thiamine transport system substrate-binding protein
MILVSVSACAETGTPYLGPEKLVLVTHDSFALSDGIFDTFTAQTGITVEVQAAGDAGELVNKLVLTKDSPLGDVVFGIDNTFAGRALGEGVLADYSSADITAAEEAFLLPAGGGREQLTPISSGDVCVNADLEWFADAGIDVPVTLDDLTDPTYRDLFVAPAANSSSPGLAFLLATIAATGEGGWQRYWGDLVDNGVKLTGGWSDAYYVDFSGPSSEGDRPLVVSYASSPPFEVAEGATVAPTAALLDTCFRQTEYAGVIAGTKWELAAGQLVDFLFSTRVQNDIPENMYVFPVNAKATLPETWASFAQVAPNPYRLDPADIDANRERWLSEWSAIAIP